MSVGTVWKKIKKLIEHLIAKFHNLEKIIDKISLIFKYR